MVVATGFSPLLLAPGFNLGSSTENPAESKQPKTIIVKNVDG
ncbi:hypothetical protein [Rhodococcus sp. NPDC006774]